ncbi:hypothetical protein CH305_10350 [Rhodococcus sp. 15-649-2-2]|uniref:VC0807 family protein n=1 Tax=Rhodococcus sp. 15-649-2-2 TaxID=2023140 RepID=UPI000B9BB0EB|nr:VC0807 family protein [Rhodococcus sp. 15-649-2-2]OZE81604.1 hypothetical protein CH305_10350 [Rhodococcus sp. 15-649-2-2]
MSNSIKTRILASSIANIAIDLLLPTVAFLLLSHVGMSATVALSIGGAVAGGKALGGRIDSGEFLWSQALFGATLPSVAILAAVALGASDVIAAVVGAVTLAVLFVGDLVTRRRSRTGMDGISILVLAEIAASVALVAISDDPRFILVRPAFYALVAAVVALTSVPTSRPFMMEASRPMAVAGDPDRARAFDLSWHASAQFRSIQRVMTAGFGAVLLAEAILRIVLVYRAPADAIAETSLTSQIPAVILFVAYFAAVRLLAVPRASKIVDAQLRQLQSA